jgi:hypothetical protein
MRHPDTGETATSTEKWRGLEEIPVVLSGMASEGDHPVSSGRILQQS